MDIIENDIAIIHHTSKTGNNTDRSIQNKNRAVPTLVHTINSHTDCSDTSPGIYNIPSATINITLRSKDHNTIHVHVATTKGIRHQYFTRKIMIQIIYGIL